MFVRDTLLNSILNRNTLYLISSHWNIHTVKRGMIILAQTRNYLDPVSNRLQIWAPIISQMWRAAHIPYLVFLETRRHSPIPRFSTPSERLPSELLPAHRSEFSLGSWSPVEAGTPAPFRDRRPRCLLCVCLTYAPGRDLLPGYT